MKMEKLGGEFTTETLEPKELARERAQSLGGTVLDVVAIERADAAIERDTMAEFQELVDEIESTDIDVLDSMAPSNRAEAEAEFLADDSLSRPNFQFDNVDSLQVAQHLELLDGIDEKIDEGGDFSDKQQLLLRIVADDKRSKNQFLQAMDNYNHAPSERAKLAAKQEFQKMNVERFGRPDKATFESILLEKFGMIKVENLSDEQKRSYDELRKKLEIDELTETESFNPKPETVERFGELIELLYANLFKHVPEGKETFTPEEVRDIVQEIIDEEFDEKIGWRAEYVPDRTAMSVNQMKKEIRIPGKRAKGDFTAEQVKGIVIGHELGTHIYRSLVHDENPVAAMRKGLPGNGEFDEGIAVCVQQALMGNYSKGRDAFHYVNIGLATFRGMNFREVFETQKQLHELMTAKLNESDEEREARKAKIAKRAFADTTRCFRGTGELVCNNDLVYQRGADSVWQYIEERIDDPEGLLRDLFLSGKANQLKPEQARLSYEAHVDGL